MDRPVRKFVLWKCKNLDLLRKNLERMKERRDEIIEEGSSVLDGQPKAKYSFSSVVVNKVMRREQLEFSIRKIEYEINTILEFQQSLSGYEREVFDETIAKESCLSAKADLLGVGLNKLVEDRAKLLRQVATRIGEYIDDEE